MDVQPPRQVDVYQENVVRRGRNGAENNIPNQEFVSFRIHANKEKFKHFCQRIKLRFPV